MDRGPVRKKGGEVSVGTPESEVATTGDESRQLRTLEGGVGAGVAGAEDAKFGGIGKKIPGH